MPSHAQGRPAADAIRTDDASSGTAADPAMQGEGNYTAARRHREAVEHFVAEGRVDQAARDAAPASAEEARDLEAAEAAGRAHARR